MPRHKKEPAWLNSRVRTKRTLTDTEVRALFARREKGECTAALAKEAGTTAANLAKRWRTRGLDATRVRKRAQTTRTTGALVQEDKAGDAR